MASAVTDTIRPGSHTHSSRAVTAFDYNPNGRIDVADVVRLFNNL